MPAAKTAAPPANPEDLSLADLQAEADALRKRINRFRESLGRFFVNKQEIIDLMVIASVAQEPLLLVGPPGTAKSDLVLKFKDALGMAEGDGCRHQHVVGDVEQRAELGFDGRVPQRHNAAQADGPGGQEQVLACGVHRRALVRTGVPMAHQTCENHDWRLLEAVDEALHGARHARLRRRVVGARPRRVPVGIALRRPHATEAHTEHGLGAHRARAVAKDEEPELLPVGARRRTRRREEHGGQVGGRHRLGREPPDRARRRQSFEETDLAVHVGTEGFEPSLKAF